MFIKWLLYFFPGVGDIAINKTKKNYWRSIKPISR